MRNPFRRQPFPAKQPVAPAPEPVEYMGPRVDTDDVHVDRTMQELARDIVRNPAFDETCRKLRSDQLRLLVSTNPEDMAAREKCYQRISALDDIVLALGALGFPESKVHPARATKRA